MRTLSVSYPQISTFNRGIPDPWITMSHQVIPTLSLLLMGFYGKILSLTGVRTLRDILLQNYRRNRSRLTKFLCSFKLLEVYVLTFHFFLFPVLPFWKEKVVTLKGKLADINILLTSLKKLNKPKQKWIRSPGSSERQYRRKTSIK